MMINVLSEIYTHFSALTLSGDGNGIRHVKGMLQLFSNPQNVLLVQVFRGPGPVWSNLPEGVTIVAERFVFHCWCAVLSA